MNKKRLLIILSVILALLLGLTAYLEVRRSSAGDTEPQVTETIPDDTQWAPDLTEPATEPEQTEAPTEEPTEAPTEAPTDPPTEPPTEAPTDPPTEPPTEPPETKPEKPKVTYTEVDVTMYVITNANVRSGPGRNYDLVGGIYAGKPVKCVARASNGWYRIEYGDTTAYIAGDLLSRTKPGEETAPPTTEPPATEPAATEAPATEPDPTAPSATEPAVTAPSATEPDPTAPSTTDPSENS